MLEQCELVYTRFLASHRTVIPNLNSCVGGGSPRKYFNSYLTISLKLNNTYTQMLAYLNTLDTLLYQ